MRGHEWAVVVGGELNALGVVRSLGRQGVRVAVLMPNSEGSAARSRYTRHLVSNVDYSELPARLLAAAAELGGRPVLFLTEEDAVRRVSAARGELAAAYRFRFGSHDKMIRLTHKQGVQALAEEAGLDIPRAVRLQSAQDLERLSTLRFPCVLKPGLKHAGYGAKFMKAYVVASIEEAERLFFEIAPTLPDLIAQEWIEGGDDAIFFTLLYMGDAGRAVSSFTGRKLRSWPPRIGGTASCVAAPDAHAELHAMTEQFFAAVGFQGMGSMEYKRDSRDGRYYVVEPTVGRTDFQEEVATVNGVNIPFAAYCYECGETPPPAQPAPLTVWREPLTDRWSSEIQGTGRATHDARVTDAYWRWYDPIPWVGLMQGRIRARLASRAQDAGNGH